MKDIEAVLDKIKAFLYDKPEIEAVYLYGSYAKGYAKNTSDIDIGVLLDSKFQYDLFYLGKLSQDVNNLGEGEIGIETFVVNDKSPMFRYKVISPRRILFSKNNDYRADFEVKTMNEYLEYRPFFDDLYKNIVLKAQERVKNG